MAQNIQPGCMVRALPITVWRKRWKAKESIVAQMWPSASGNWISFFAGAARQRKVKVLAVSSLSFAYIQHKFRFFFFANTIQTSLTLKCLFQFVIVNAYNYHNLAGWTKLSELLSIFGVMYQYALTDYFSFCISPTLYTRKNNISCQ